MHVSCPNCGEKFVLVGTLAGSLGLDCPTCHHRVRIRSVEQEKADKASEASEADRAKTERASNKPPHRDFEDTEQDVPEAWEKRSTPPPLPAKPAKSIGSRSRPEINFAQPDDGNDDDDDLFDEAGQPRFRDGQPFPSALPPPRRTPDLPPPRTRTVHKRPESNFDWMRFVVLPAVVVAFLFIVFQYGGLGKFGSVFGGNGTGSADPFAYLDDSCTDMTALRLKRIRSGPMKSWLENGPMLAQLKRDGQIGDFVDSIDLIYEANDESGRISAVRFDKEISSATLNKGVRFKRSYKGLSIRAGKDFHVIQPAPNLIVRTKTIDDMTRIIDWAQSGKPPVFSALEVDDMAVGYRGARNRILGNAAQDKVAEVIDRDQINKHGVTRVEMHFQFSEPVTIDVTASARDVGAARDLADDLNKEAALVHGVIDRVKRARANETVNPMVLRNLEYSADRSFSARGSDVVCLRRLPVDMATVAFNPDAMRPITTDMISLVQRFSDPNSVAAAPPHVVNETPPQPNAADEARKRRDEALAKTKGKRTTKPRSRNDLPPDVQPSKSFEDALSEFRQKHGHARVAILEMEGVPFDYKLDKVEKLLERLTGETPADSSAHFNGKLLQVCFGPCADIQEVVKKINFGDVECDTSAMKIKVLVTRPQVLD